MCVCVREREGGRWGKGKERKVGGSGVGEKDEERKDFEEASLS